MRDALPAALLALVLPHGRIVIVEDSQELAPQHPQAVLTEVGLLTPSLAERPARLTWSVSHCACVRTGWWDKG